ncbi:MAG TPA: UTP--glucose-1-phosphate uridylyltransferase GalU [Candidatus Methylomirabilis sp.]|nr:UTP--glucose-1-phosphate uridylyltransferase GalU [Candidatus Methylomirabilis sp.]HSB78896.1 UTP--glucose-1-phosphate uridylyltransferase GalU [Candidatus Methylomirabilis sp.]HSC71824.1 UTP--glucose-1-phosphate uridylyltransferase GalU [Candidatus Methylomirabilis sp.]
MTIRKAVFPAAGLGTRFLPATKAQPKEMLPIVDKPTIQYVMEEAVASGIQDIIVVTGRGKNAIEDHFDRSIELELMLARKGRPDLLEVVRRVSELVRVCYVRQGEPLGLGHAVLAAKELVGDEPFAVLLGDDILTDTTPALQQMIEVHEKHRCSVMCVKRVPKADVSRYGVIKGRKVDEHLYHIMDMVEKPEVGRAPSDLAVIGRYILTPDVFPLLEKTAEDRTGEIQLTNALKGLLKGRRNMIYALEFQGHWHDAGTVLGFLKTTVEFALLRPDVAPGFKEFLRGLDLR